MKSAKSVLLLSIFFANFQVLSAAIPAAERQALIDLYNSTHGDGWNQKLGWKTAPLHSDGFSLPGTEYKWFGIITDAVNTTVLEINLRSNDLRGELLSSLGNLSNLERLDLNGEWTGALIIHVNSLDGIIPPSLGNLQHLKYLNLDYSNFKGSIPSSLGNLKELQYFYLSGGNLTGGIPPELGNMSNLLVFWITRGNMTGGLPPELGNLTNLQRLIIESNPLSGGIPPSLGNLSHLQNLHITSTQLTGSIPQELGNLSNLGYLYLEYNQISGNIPASLGNLSRLNHLYLSGNCLSGSIPTELGNLSHLTCLKLDSNQLSGSIPASLSKISTLSVYGGVDLGYNSLYCLDEALEVFLYFRDSDWDTTQTIAPTNLTAVAGVSSATISWTPIIFTSDTGGYRVFYSTTKGGPYTFHAQTANKSTTSQLVTGLTPGIPYYFVVQTRTDSHARNQNVVTSENSLEVAATAISAPEIGLSKKSFIFGSEQNGTPTRAQSSVINNSGLGVLIWTAVPSADWISVVPGSGTDPGVLTISISRTDMPPGSYAGTITISAPGAPNSPQTVTVNLRIYDGTNPPFGVVDTPTDNATGIEGSVPMTGWAVDDVEVESVKIYRSKVEGEGVAQMLNATEAAPEDWVYISDAIFVEGARPDVEAAYPTHPLNSRAGWGYMMLTNFLPNQGNGTFVIHAIATDREGNTTLLGSRTITCDNAHATLPFGAIDTPSQGGTASGNAYRNFAWVLATMGKCIPAGGSTITAWVDGLPIGHPQYGYYRVDIATLFPGFCNATGAIGYIDIDTTKYTNGVHTIVWSATDSAGVNNGFGSRHWQIQNSAASVKEDGILGAQGIAAAPGRTFRKASDVEAMPYDLMAPVRVRRGYQRDVPPEPVYPDENGVLRIEIRELDRIEIDLADDTGGTIREGYLKVGHEIRPLPIGTTLDTERWIFYWQPGVGFIGEYEFIFLIGNGVNVPLRKSIKVKIVPRA